MQTFANSLFSRQASIQEAAGYTSLPFHEKSKNRLIAFTIIAAVVELALFWGKNLYPVNENVLVNVLAYLVLLPFVYLNHRWAMTVIALLYTIDKALLILGWIGNPVRHIIFLILMGGLIYRSFLTASYLKERRAAG